MKKLLCFALFLLTFSLWAQDLDLDALLEGLDDDSLFELTEEEAVEEEEDDVSPLEMIEVEDNLFQWGGRIYSDLGSSFIWNNFDGWADETSFDPQLGLDLFFDARPSDNFRVFAKGKAFYPFDGSIEDVFSLHELFSDFNVNNKLYFRVGKQTINWGVGYLSKPTDKLNVSPLDPSDRDADREGPLAVKSQIPLGVNTIYLYAIAHEIERPEDITYAPKVEFLLGNWEFGVGAILNPSLTPKGALFVTGPIWKLDFFAEALFQYGSDLEFISEIPDAAPPVTFSKEDELIVSATGGLLFHQSSSYFTAIGQYWYDGEAQSADDWSVVGHHFAGVTLEKGFVLQPEKETSGMLNLSVLWLGNFTDLSGMVMPEIEYEFVKYASVALGATIRYGEELSYYRYTGPDSASAPLEVKLSLRLGYGNF